MKLIAVTLLTTAVASTGCTAGRHTSHTFKAPNGVKCAYHNYTANLYGPGLRRSDLLCDGDPGFISLAHAAGPDAGVAAATAGLQGAGIAGGAAVLGTSFPANKGTHVQATGGVGTGTGTGTGVGGTGVGGTVNTTQSQSSIGTFNMPPPYEHRD